jgi:primosomal protein N' (replication factor Y) (superfamily II helicase)
LIGVINADMSLHVPDFRAGERTFQLLTQVAGRAGRGEIAGEVIVQTFTPHHPAIQAAQRADYIGFYDQEMKFREELSYPPFTHLICITIRSRVEAKGLFCANELMKIIRGRLPSQVIVSEITPAPLAKAKGYYRHQILMRAPSTLVMSRAIRSALEQFRWPKDVNYGVDVDALSLM